VAKVHDAARTCGEIVAFAENLKARVRTQGKLEGRAEHHQKELLRLRLRLSRFQNDACGGAGSLRPERELVWLRP
jgi:hypothetical protein